MASAPRTEGPKNPDSPPLAQYAKIPVAAIQPSPHQTRKEFDEESLRGLAASLRLEGLVEPIVVRPIPGITPPPNPSDEPGIMASLFPKPVYELISGERRLRAAKMLGWEKIEAKILHTSSDAEAAAKGLAENLQREDLNPIEEAEGFRDLQRLDPGLWTQAKIAKLVGKDSSYVCYSMLLLRLPDEIKEGLRRRNISRSHAIELLRLPDPVQQVRVARAIPGRLTREETRRLVDSLLSTKPPKRPKRWGKPLVQRDASAFSARPDSGLDFERDPLAPAWKALMEDPRLGGSGSWEVRSEGGGCWTLYFGAVEEDPVRLHQTVGTWLLRLGQLMINLGKAEPEARRKGGDETAPGPRVPENQDVFEEKAQTASAPAPAPKIRQAVFLPDQRVALEWEAVPHAERYEVYYSYDPARLPLVPVKGSENLRETRWMINVADAKKPWIFFAVRAFYAIGESPLSALVKVELKQNR